jgi:hypothetical protein
MMENKISELKDKNGVRIKSGDFVSLDGNMTTDDSLGALPNGWTFDETDVYEVYWDERISNWSLKLNVEPSNAYNVKYMNHAVSLLHSGDVEIVTRPAILNNKEENDERRD